jgi:4-hydroxy-tetrahydrodipicolinate synthase
MKSVTDSMLNDDYSSARKYNNRYLKMMNALFVETSPSPVKYVMSKLGFCENILRLPLISASEKAEQLLDNEMSLLSNL